MSEVSATRVVHRAWCVQPYVVECQWADYLSGLWQQVRAFDDYDSAHKAALQLLEGEVILEEFINDLTPNTDQEHPDDGKTIRDEDSQPRGEGLPHGEDRE